MRVIKTVVSLAIMGLIAAAYLSVTSMNAYANCYRNTFPSSTSGCPQNLEAGFHGCVEGYAASLIGGFYEYVEHPPQGQPGNETWEAGDGWVDCIYQYWDPVAGTNKSSTCFNYGDATDERKAASHTCTE